MAIFHLDRAISKLVRVWGEEDLGLMEDGSFKVEHQIVIRCLYKNHLTPQAPF